MYGVKYIVMAKQNIRKRSDCWNERIVLLSSDAAQGKGSGISNSAL